MSEQVTIKELLGLEEKFFKGVEVENLQATIEMVLKHRDVSGTKDGKPYSFKSQFIVITDGEGNNIGVDFTFQNEADALTNNDVGVSINVASAKGDTYINKKGIVQKKLTKAKFDLSRNMAQEESKPSGEDKPRAVIKGGKKEDQAYWDSRNRVITRTAIAKSMLEGGRKLVKATAKAIETELETWYDLVMKEGTKNSTEKKQLPLDEFHTLKNKLIDIKFWDEDDATNYTSEILKPHKNGKVGLAKIKKGIVEMKKWVKQEEENVTKES